MPGKMLGVHQRDAVATVACLALFLVTVLTVGVPEPGSIMLLLAAFACGFRFPGKSTRPHGDRRRLQGRMERKGTPQDTLFHV